MNLAEIRKLPMREKFQIMEALWEDMRDQVEDADLPESHKIILDGCRARVAAGEEKMLDWEEVKNNWGGK